MPVLLYLGILALGLLTLRAYLIPYLLSRFTPFHVKSISLKNIRGFEWRAGRGGNADAPVILKVERLGWEWCVKGHRGISIVVENVDIVLNDQDLAEIGRSTGKGGIRGLGSKGVFGLGFVYYTRGTLSLSLDSIDSVFDVTYDAEPAFITPKAALNPDTPFEPRAVIPGSFFPPSTEASGDDGESESRRQVKGDKIKREWGRLWRKVMGRASGRVVASVVVSKCRVARIISHAEQKDSAVDVIDLAENSSLNLALTFGKLKHGQKANSLANSAPLPRFAAYLAVNSISIDSVLSPVTLDMRQIEQLVLNDKVHRHRVYAEASSQFPRRQFGKEAEADRQQKMLRRQTALQSIGRAVDRLTFSVSTVTMLHAMEASYLGPKLSDEKVKTSFSQDSGFVRGHNDEPGYEVKAEHNHRPLKEIVVAVVVTDFTIESTSITQTNSSPLRQLFGRPFSANLEDHGLIRGMEIVLRHSDMKLQRLGMPSNVSATLASTGSMEITAITTIFSGLLGWSQSAYLDEPDHYLLQLQWRTHHLHVHASLDLITQFILEARAWATHHKMERHAVPEGNVSATSVQPVPTRKSRGKIPKIIAVCEIGNVDIRVASDEVRSAVECRLTNSGMHVAGHTTQYDICARVLSKDPKAKTRNHLQYGYTSAMAWDFGGEIARTAISIGNSEDRGDSRPFEIIKIGQALMTSNGVLRGRANEGQDTIDYDSKSRTGKLTFSIDGGVDIRIWRSESHDQISDWLSSLKLTQSMLRRPRNDVVNSVIPDPLRSLPSGMIIKVSTGTISTLIASRDPNPECDLGIIRGVHMQTALTLDYCYFAHQEQISRSRQLVDDLQRRSKLHLRAGLETEAEALANKLLASGGGAALFGLDLREIIIEPVFNAQNWRFNAQMPDSYPSSAELFPQRTARNPSYAVWDFQLMQRKQSSTSPGNVFSNNKDPFDLDYRQQIQKPIFSAPDITTSFNIVRGSMEEDLENQIIGRMSYGELSADLSHIHCMLLARQAIANCRPPEPAPETKNSEVHHKQHRIPMTARFRIDYLEADILFPIGERIFWSVSEVHLVHLPEVRALTVRSGMVFVPSARQVGKFEELGRFKAVAAAIEGHKRPSIEFDAEAFRIRVPYRYEPSKLFLNINATVKATRILLKGIKTPTFQVTQLPTAKAPKRIPDIAIRLKNTSFEIKDDPLETKLNLIFRVGKMENGPRSVRQAYFDAKAALIKNAEEKHTLSSIDVEEIKERYNVNLEHSVPTAEAWIRFHKYNSDIWQDRMRKARHVQNKREERELFRQYGYKTDYSDLPIEVVAPQRFAPLFRGSLDNLHARIRDPNLDRASLLKHMEAHAGPFPADQEFSLFVPLKIRLASRNVDFTLRDYPLPLWRIMPLESDIRDTDEKHSAMVCDLTVVLAEELAKDEDSFFWIPCRVIPKGTGDPLAAALELKIAKTLAPVKSYADVNFSIRSPRPTDFTWGVSYQPAISDLTRALATFTHPPRDPSPRLSFWDKFRLTLHWKVAFDFAAPCHLHLKGSSDPYEITKRGAGFVLAWMGHPKIRIGYENPERELIQISSDQMILSVPDLTAFIDPMATGDKSSPHVDTGKETEELPGLLDRRLNKTCANFRGGVCVGFAFKFERTCRDENCQNGCRGDPSMRECRIFDFLPHHAIKLRPPKSPSAQQSENDKDSYEGFRSDFIHFSPSIVANRQGEKHRQSSFHFTPMGFAHFFAWWRLFNHAMSLPIRQGSLFPFTPPPSKKFGRSLATIKYRFDIHDLYISHVYPQYSQNEWLNGYETAVGLKAHIARFQADIHQREQFQIKKHLKLGTTQLVKHKAIYAAETIFYDTKVKAVRAVFDSPVKQTLGVFEDNTGEPPLGGRGVYAKDLNDHDTKWFNIDDFVDTDVRPVDDNPMVEFYRVLTAPLCRYSRYIPALMVSSRVIENLKAGKFDATEWFASKFGREPSHRCLLSEAPMLENFNNKLIDDRIHVLRTRQEQTPDIDTKAEIDRNIKILEEGRRSMHARMHSVEYTIDRRNSMDGFDARDRMTEREGAGYENVYHIHSPRLSIDNTSRNILIQYYFSNRMRRGFEYHMSNKAVRALEKQLREAFVSKHPTTQSVGEIHKPHVDLDDIARKVGSTLAAGIVGQLLGDYSRSTAEDDPQRENSKYSCEITPSKDLPKEFGIRKSIFGALIHPQILLSSEIDNSSTILLTANVAKLRTFTVEDGEFPGDKVNGVVMHRNYGALEGLQSFFPLNDSDNPNLSLTFVPMEVLLDNKLETTEFDRLVASTECSLRFDKFNQLRLVHPFKHVEGSSEHLKNYQDLAVVNVPAFGVVANARHFAAIYNILTDLILYQDPEQRQRSQQLDTFLYSFVAEDRHRYNREVRHLQDRIRERGETYRIYEEHHDRLSVEGIIELGRVRSDLLEDIHKLNLIFNALAILQSHNKAAADLRSSLRLEAHARELAWFMLDEDKLIAKLAIKDIHYTWVRKKDSSTENALVIQDLQALSTSPDAYYVEIISRYEKAAQRNDDPMVQVFWSALAPVGGISILESFKLRLFPLRVQLERAIGRALHDYVFHNRVTKNNESASQRKHKKKEKSADSETLENGLHVKRKQHIGIHRSSSGIFNGNHGSRAQLPQIPSLQDTSASAILKQEELNAEEMRVRATKNRTFISIDIEPTTLLFSYKSDKAKSFSNVQDIRAKTPHLVYENKVWSFEDLAGVMRKDMLKSAWNQKGQLLSDLFRKKHRPTATAREQHLPGPSNLSISHSAAESYNADDAAADAIEQADIAPVLPDTVALVKTPDEIESLAMQGFPDERDHPSVYSMQSDSQNSTEQIDDQKKSRRMNRLIQKLRGHKRD
ncbi:hypothetical protein QFC19_009011 [Naganishia cerealis]|uniref:Uncharacterized protein n=1 Tax=Naganishia cerealis TaxID=610337 RepID=A0ACC2UY33_9TREE|nr:hypothetical protein QFC19_009011 [Naganishia cerealis]